MTDHNPAPVPVRANHDGDPCPEWCGVDHEAPLVPGEPRLGLRSDHISDPVASHGSPYVRLSKIAGGKDAPFVRLSSPAFGAISLTPAEADTLAGILQDLPEPTDRWQLIGELRTAAGMIGEYYPCCEHCEHDAGAPRDRHQIPCAQCVLRSPEGSDR